MYQRLKQLRLMLDMTQGDFAKALGLSQSSLAMLETGKRKLSDKHLKLISSAFGVSEHWLRTGEGEVYSATPFAGEFMDIFQHLRPENQKYLLTMAQGLLKTQRQLLNSSSAQEDN